MTKTQREDVRQALLDAGFVKDYSTPERPELYDRTQNGAYEEDWRHVLDNTTLTIRWDKKTK